MTLPGRKAPAIWRAPKYTGPDRRKTRRWRPRPLRVLLALLIVAGIGYAVAVLWLITQETRIVFQAGRTLATGRPAFPYGQVDLPRADGARQFAWVMRRGASDDGTWVLFLHGNAATIASKVNIAHYTDLRALGLNVLAPEYRGFGGLEGEHCPAIAGVLVAAEERDRVADAVGPGLERECTVLGDELAHVDAARPGEHPEVALGDRHLAALVCDELPAAEARAARDLRQRESLPSAYGSQLLADLLRVGAGDGRRLGHDPRYRPLAGLPEG